MTEMVERVARAMYVYPWDKIHPEDKEYWLEQAKAAIQAMRQPTPDMIEAGCWETSDDLVETYQAMIDKALA